MRKKISGAKENVKIMNGNNLLVPKKNNFQKRKGCQLTPKL